MVVEVTATHLALATKLCSDLSPNWKILYSYLIGASLSEPHAARIGICIFMYVIYMVRPSLHYYVTLSYDDPYLDRPCV